MTRVDSTGQALSAFMWAVAAEAPRLTVAAVALALTAGVFEGVGLLALVPLLQLVGLDTTGGSLGGILRLFEAAFAAVGLAPTLPVVLGTYVGIVALQAVVQRQNAIVQTRLREDIVHAMRTRLYRAVAGTTWVHFSRRRAATFGEILTQRVDRVANAAYYLLDLLVTGVMAGAYAVLAVTVSPSLTALVAVAGALMLLVLRHRLHLARARGAEYTAAATRLHTAAFDHLDSMKMTKGYGAEARHAAQFSRLSRELGDASERALLTSSTTRLWLAIGSAALLAALVYTASALVGMAPATLFLLIFLFARLVPRLTLIYEKAQVMLGELPAFETVMRAEAECLAEAEPHVDAHEDIALDAAVTCERVTFGYGGDGSPTALHDVTLRIAAHATTAIVGPSGAGKSTLADLLMGLVTPQSGTVRVDEIALTPDRLQAWRSRVGYVSQDTFLFHDTVRANLLWARPDADDSAIWTALEQAAAADFVRRMPQGLDTVVGDRGLLLSGGERQRLSLARALLRQPQVLILDEATSSLDSENERRIQEAIERLHRRVTIVVITHRLSTIRNADVIHVLERGTIVESGTWSYLQRAGTGRFRALLEAQGLHEAVLPAVPAPSSDPDGVVGS